MSWLNENLIQTIGLICGGLAIFVFGIQMMSDALKSIAGVKIREYIDKYTSHLFYSITVGTIISALLHSSSAVTVISISLVRAGLMGLKQAIGITIGANIGTCVTSIMIGLNIEQFSYYFVFLGVMMMLLTKRKKMTYIGKVLAGFGLIFVGLEMMSNELVMISKQAWFIETMKVLGQQPVFACLGGTIATGIMQSSTAVIGIVQKLYVTGCLSPYAGAAFIFGANVGTCVTAMIASFGGSIATKRASLFHVVYNVVGAIIGMFLLTPFVALINVVNDLIAGGAEMYIAQAHFVFNVISTILVIPFVGSFIKLLNIIVPGVDEHSTKIENIDQLDDTLIEKFPVAALAVAKKNTLRMGRNILANMQLSHAYLLSHNNEDYDEFLEIESLINKYDTSLSVYLLKIANQPTLSQEQCQEYYKNYQIIKYLESIGDELNHLMEFYHMVYEEKGSFSTYAIEDLNQLYELIKEMVNDALHIFEIKNVMVLLPLLNEKEKTLNELELQCRQNHFERMKQNICDSSIASSVILDILSHLERIGDLALNIANGTVLPYVTHQQKYIDPSTLT